MKWLSSGCIMLKWEREHSLWHSGRANGFGWPLRVHGPVIWGRVSWRCPMPDGPHAHSIQGHAGHGYPAPEPLWLERVLQSLEGWCWSLIILFSSQPHGNLKQSLKNNAQTIRTIHHGQVVPLEQSMVRLNNLWYLLVTRAKPISLVGFHVT